MPSRRLILSGLAAGLLLPVLPAWAAAPVDPTSPDLPAVTALIQAAIKRYGLDGVAAIAHHRGHVLYRGYFGDIGPGKAIPVASASKWVAGLVIMALVEQGKLRLDLTLAQAGLAQDGPASVITLAQLMSHTAAMPVLGPWRQDRRYPTPEAAARDVRNMDLIGRPGSVFAYGGTSMQVAAYLAEQAGGADWNSLFRRLIGDPLGLSPACRWGDKWGVAGGLWASPDDYERILRLIATRGLTGSGTRVLPESLFAHMEHDQMRGAERRELPDAAEAMKGYGIGFWCETVATDGSCPILSSPGAFGTYPLIDRARDLSILLMVKSRLPKLVGDWRAIIRALVAAADAEG